MAKSIAELEATLDSRIVEVSGSDVDSFSTRPEEREIEYELAPADRLPHNSEALSFAISHNLTISANRQEHLDLVKSRLGASAADLFLAQLAKEAELSPAVQAGLRTRINNAPLELSAACRSLGNVLLGFKDQDDFHGIVFVERRSHVLLLVELLKRVRELDNFRMASLVGHGGVGGPVRGRVKEAGMQVKEVSRPQSDSVVCLANCRTLTHAARGDCGQVSLGRDVPAVRHQCGRGRPRLPNLQRRHPLR